MRRNLQWSVLVFAVAAVLVVSRGYGGDRGEKKGAAGKDVRIDGELTDDDPFDKLLKKSRAKVHPFKMTAGKTYKIEMITKSKIDPFLRLEDAKGEQLALDDDGAGFPNARIIFKAAGDGEFRVIATTFPAAESTGKYTLTIEEINWKQYLAEQVKPFADKGADIGGKDIQTALQMAMGLEGGSKDLAAETYAEFAKIFAKASDPKVADISKMMDGASRRMKLMGNPIAVHGQTLDGKDFDWKSYKGKVVLVDFWATWCGPCRAEIPNMKKMYEKYHDKGFDVVAVSIDMGKDAPVKYMESEKLPWVCLFDPQPGKGLEPLMKHYGVFSIPQAILVGRNGQVVSMSARGEELERLLEKHIGARENSDK